MSRYESIIPEDNPMLEQISQDLREAMKARDKLATSTLRLMKTALQNALIAKKQVPLTDEDCLRIFSTEAKRRREAAEAFRQGGKEEMAAQEEAELKIIQEYLPQQLTDEEVRDLAKKVMGEIQPTSARDLGKVMGKFMPQIKGKFDGKLANKIVREEFQNSIA